MSDNAPYGVYMVYATAEHDDGTLEDLSILVSDRSARAAEANALDMLASDVGPNAVWHDVEVVCVGRSES